jgi:chaperonin cofactor prefoldin
MHKQKCGCSCSCHGRQYPTKEEKRKHLEHKKECLEKELQGIKEALEELDK